MQIKLSKEKTQQLNPCDHRFHRCDRTDAPVCHYYVRRGRLTYLRGREVCNYIFYLCNLRNQSITNLPAIVTVINKETSLYVIPACF